MNCPKCAAESRVLQTRRWNAFMVKRERQCSMNHRFATYEVFATNIDKRTLDVVRRGIEARSKARMRERAVLLNPGLSAAILARRLGCTEARVRQLRRSWGDGEP